MTLILYDFSILISTFSFRLVVRTSRKIHPSFALNSFIKSPPNIWKFRLTLKSLTLSVPSFAFSFISPSLEILTSVFAAASDSQNEKKNSFKKIPSDTCSVATFYCDFGWRHANLILNFLSRSSEQVSSEGGAKLIV